MWCRHGAFVDPAPGSFYYSDTQFDIDITWYGPFANAGNLYPFLALGGSVLSASNQATLAVGTTTSITGLGFRPNCILFCFNDHAYPFSDNPTFIGYPVVGSWGVGNGVNQWSIGYCQSYISPDQHKRRMHDNAVFFNFDWTGTIRIASLASLDADGFTLSHDSGLGGRPFGYLALRCDQVPTVGTAVQGFTSLATSGFRPGGIFVGSAGVDVVDDLQSGTDIMFGVSSDSELHPNDSYSMNQVFHELPNHGPAANLDRNLIGSIGPQGPISGPSSVTAAADISSWNANSISMSWSADDGDGRLYGYVIFPYTQADQGLQPMALISPRACGVRTSPGYVSGHATAAALLGVGYSAGPGDGVLMDVFSSARADDSMLGMESYNSAGASGTNFSFVDNHYDLRTPGDFGDDFVPGIYRYDHM